MNTQGFNNEDRAGDGMKITREFGRFRGRED